MDTQPVEPVDQRTREAFASDGAAHAKAAVSVPYNGPKLANQPKIAVQGRDGRPAPVPQASVAATILGRNTIAELEPTDPQAVFNQAVALYEQSAIVTRRAFDAAMALRADARPSKLALEQLLTGLDDMANRTVQLRHSLSTHG